MKTKKTATKTTTKFKNNFYFSKTAQKFISVAVISGICGFFVGEGYASQIRPTWESKGIVNFTEDSSVVFNSSDLDTIYNEIISGKQTISQSLKAQNPNEESLSHHLSGDGTDTFTALSSAINSQITLPSDTSGNPVLPTYTIRSEFYNTEGTIKTERTVNSSPITTFLGENNTLLSNDIEIGKLAYTPEGNPVLGCKNSETEKIDFYNNGKSETLTTVVYNNFGGKQIVAYDGTVSLAGYYVTERSVLTDIDTEVFDQLIVKVVNWSGSGSGRSVQISHSCTLYIRDQDGNVLYSQSAAGPSSGYDYTIDLTPYRGKGLLKFSAAGNWYSYNGEAGEQGVGTSNVSNIRLRVRANG